ncbi:hypothetical protein WJX72_008891 [[Myrmecia] bisecta]|uniref:LysM domain-containing protein n=1 Tax=[Myrmecia] bisecta TaxID=41462 RepID=A0AAW1PKL9_9CHLO
MYNDPYSCVHLALGMPAVACVQPISASSFHIQLGEEVEPGAAPRPVTVAVTVEKDQTLLSLAKQTAIPYEKLLAVNRGKRHVKKGQVDKNRVPRQGRPAAPPGMVRMT